MSRTACLIAMILVCLTAIIAALLTDPIAQDPLYHLFKDNRTMFRVPNFLNVISNLPFFIVGLMGIKRITGRQVQIVDDFQLAYFVLFLGISLTAIGSGYYHWQPANHTLVWDRLPMTLAFMSLLAIIIAEFISVRVAKILLWPLLILGIYSVLHWYFGELKGQGDLRFYALVQFLPVLLISIIVLRYPSTFSNVKIYWLLLLCYLLAKLTEYFDGRIFDTLVIISGHSLKHIIAAVGLWILLDGYTKRSTV